MSLWRTHGHALIVTVSEDAMPFPPVTTIEVVPPGPGATLNVPGGDVAETVATDVFWLCAVNVPV